LPDKTNSFVGLPKKIYPANMVQPVLKPTVILLRKIRSAFRLPIRSLGMVLFMWLLLWVARLVIALCPLRRLARFFGHDHGAMSLIPVASEAQIARATRLRAAMVLAVKYSPSFANCYPQALVARLLLRAKRLPHALFFGLKRNDQTRALDAHAWVMVGPVAVTGGNGFESYAAVRCFASVLPVQ
jgi:hypothetical protein